MLQFIGRTRRGAIKRNTVQMRIVTVLFLPPKISINNILTSINKRWANHKRPRGRFFLTIKPLVAGLPLIAFANGDA